MSATRYTALVRIEVDIEDVTVEQLGEARAIIAHLDDTHTITLMRVDDRQCPECLATKGDCACDGLSDDEDAREVDSLQRARDAA